MPGKAVILRSDKAGVTFSIWLCLTANNSLLRWIAGLLTSPMPKAKGKGHKYSLEVSHGLRVASILELTVFY